MTERLADWEQRLHDYIAALEGRAFEWGVLDCALFAAGAVEAQTGVDPAAAYRGQYSTATGSVRVLRRLGAGTLEATFDAAFEREPVGYARRGDLVMVDGIAGVCLGGVALFVGDVDGAPGWVRHDRAAWSAAWRIG
jgi:hypothetical protein